MTRKGVLSILFLIIMLLGYLLVKETPVSLRQEIVESPNVVQTMGSNMLNIDLYSANAILVNLDENQVLLEKKVRK
ncbi:hypothetical protein [Lysinibacillus sp. FW12]|uniref:hypothetical protein n=1 Tax=Lysinibacillus sp. FW12 TaxID=3096079 RepID=UPI003D7664DA